MENNTKFGLIVFLRLFVVSGIFGLPFLGQPTSIHPAVNPDSSATLVMELRTKAEAGDSKAQFRLGDIYINGVGVPQNMSLAVKWYERSAMQGNADAQYRLGTCFDQGKGVTKDPAQAFAWFRKAADQGQASAQTMLGVYYEMGVGGVNGVAIDHAEAVKWFRKAAEQGYANGQWNLGLCFAEGKGVEQNLDESVKWYRKAAVQGHPIAQYLLGFHYSNGFGVPQNFPEAYVWLVISANNHQKEAPELRDAVAKRLSPQALQQARSQAERLYQEIQMGILPFIENSTDTFLASGSASNQIVDAPIIEELKLKALSGDTTVQFQLGDLFLKGICTTKNYVEAAKWFLLSAEKGHAEAQSALGIIYKEGLGTPKDFKLAAKWFYEAAKQGNVDAQCYLGLMYANGQGVIRDLVQASSWLQKAADQGSVLGRSSLDGVKKEISARNTVAMELTEITESLIRMANTRVVVKFALEEGRLVNNKAFQMRILEYEKFRTQKLKIASVWRVPNYKNHIIEQARELLTPPPTMIGFWYAPPEGASPARSKKIKKHIMQIISTEVKNRW